jgi:hypothetical protein
LAETVRFELTDPFEPLVFKTSAIDHSTTFPYLASPEGLEPSLTVLETGMLPLH